MKYEIVLVFCSWWRDGILMTIIQLEQIDLLVQARVIGDFEIYEAHWVKPEMYQVTFGLYPTLNGVLAHSRKAA